MAINLLRYSTGNDDPTWGVVRGNTVLPLPGQYATTADVLDQGADAARTLLGESGKPEIPLTGVTPLNPVAGARVVCQGANYQAHIAESGMDPNRLYNLLFTKSSGSHRGTGRHRRSVPCEAAGLRDRARHCDRQGHHRTHLGLS